MGVHPHMDDEHVDAACAWLNLEFDVLGEIAERETGLDDLRLMVRVNAGAEKFLVDGFGQEGQEIFDRYSGGDLPKGLSNKEMAQEIKARFEDASLDLAFYLLASRWSELGILREAGASDEAFAEVGEKTWARLAQAVGEARAERAWELTAEFIQAAHSGGAK